MFYNNISYMVGSANAKLANDIKLANKKECNSYVLDKVANKLNTYLCRQMGSDQNDKKFNLDFELVRISCKKEFDEASKETKIIKKLAKIIKLKWILRAFLFALVGCLVGFSIFRIVDKIIESSRKSEDDFKSNSKRNIDYFMSYLKDWSGEKIPSIYEIEPFTFYDSNADSFGDLNGIKLKLDFLKRVLKVNTILIKNLQSAFDFDNYQVELFSLTEIDHRLGNKTDLQNLIAEAHRKSIKVILEIDLTGTSNQHILFKQNPYLYKVLNNTDINTKEINSFTNNWSFDENSNIYYYTSGRKNYAQYNFDNETVQLKIEEAFKFWSSNFSADGLYIKSFNSIFYKNSTSFQNFIQSIRNICHTYPLVIIGEFSVNDQLKNSLYDIYHVNLDSINIYNSILNSSNPFELYLMQDKKIIWSLDYLDYLPYQYGYRRSLIMSLYGIAYSLPGIVLVKQGDDLEYERKYPLHPKIYRWDDLVTHSGFSNYSENLLWLRTNKLNRINNGNSNIYKATTISQSILHEFGLDFKLAEADLNSLLNMIILLNDKTKSKLNDIKPKKMQTTRYPVIPKAPEPFVNSDMSISDLYVSKYDYLDLKIENSLFKLTRQINNYQAKRKDYTLFSIKFYRNVEFIVNFSSMDKPIDQLINLPLLGSHISNYQMRNQPQIPIHIIYDSSRTLPEYIQLNSENHESFYLIKSKSFVILEF